MISPEILRRFSYFGGLTNEQIIFFAKIGAEIRMPAGQYFFHSGEELNHIYIILEGEVSIVVEVPHKKDGFVVSKRQAGDVFGWSGLVPPHLTTAGVRADTDCMVIAIDCRVLRQKFEEDCRFGYLMMSKTAEVIRARLEDLRIEALADIVKN